VDKSELSKLFLHKIPKGTPREDLARAFGAALGAHVQMVTWGASGTGTTFALFKNPEIANKAFKSLVGREHKVRFLVIRSVFRCYVDGLVRVGEWEVSNEALMLFIGEDQKARLCSSKGLGLVFKEFLVYSGDPQTRRSSGLL
jgi:hypothetical protein